ncbi:unnamed protein product [Paramecium primaurelia]|uniref:non-specific serine/threonine protein kinase n=1 Tax=Paramecium primaurelia TaxID=5886 RepID=A0A8S1P7Z8_PARPR|nr:unnamed protein product [Paramecium primaurelia]
MINQCSKKSFFSYFQMKWEPLTHRSFDLQDVFQISMNSKGKFQKAHLKLSKQFLCLNDKEQLDVSNYMITKVDNKILGQGIRIQSFEFSIEFYGSIEKWFEQLSLYCIQTNFTQKYQVQKLVGAGTYGKVYRVKNKINQNIYAVKTFEKQLLNSLDDQEGLIKEIGILRTLDHRGVIKLHEVYESEQFVFLVFEFLQNKNLNDTLERGVTIPESQAFNIINDLLETVQYIHEQGILHRDLKPDNILLRNETQKYVIIDFGLADIYREDGQYLFKKCGTPGYCAPEILCNQIYDQKVDVYSLGVILYQMLTGLNPFYSKNYDDRYKLNKESKLDYSKVKVSYDALDLLQGMLNRNPQKRFSAKEALNHRYFQQQKKHHHVPSLSHLSDTLLNTGSQISSPRLDGNFNFFEIGESSSRYTSPLLSPKLSPRFDGLDKEILNHQNTYSCHISNLKLGGQKINYDETLEKLIQKYQKT